MSERTRVVVLAAIALLVYANTLANGLVFDDAYYILLNHAVTSGSLRALIRPTANNVFRPVTFLTFAANWAVAGAKPFGYHLVNILLHALVVLALYCVLRLILQGLVGGERIAFVAALLFAVHPIHTEAVAWATARSELLAAGFLLGAWFFHLKDRPVGMLLCFVLALLAKESTVVFLPLALAGDYAAGKFKSALRYGGIAAVTGIYLVLLWYEQGGRFGQVSVSFLDNPLANLPIGLRLLNAMRIAWRYVGLLVYPHTLSSDYSYNAIPIYAKWRYGLYSAIGITVVLVTWFWTLWTKRSAWLLGLTIYICGFAVASNVVFATGTIMAERLAYLPSAGLCLLAALAYLRLERVSPKAGMVTVVALASVLGVRTIARNRDWRDNYRLYAADVTAVPGSAKIHANFAGELMKQGELERAEKEFQVALRIDPDFLAAMESYGITKSRLGQDVEARRLLEKGLSLTPKGDPNYDDRVVILTGVLRKLGDEDRALWLLNEEIREGRADSRVWSNRAAILYTQGQNAGARSDAETALQMDSDNAQARTVLNALRSPLRVPANP